MCMIVEDVFVVWLPLHSSGIFDCSKQGMNIRGTVQSTYIHIHRYMHLSTRLPACTGMYCMYRVDHD